MKKLIVLNSDSPTFSMSLDGFRRLDVKPIVNTYGYTILGILKSSSSTDSFNIFRRNKIYIPVLHFNDVELKILPTMEPGHSISFELVAYAF